MSSFQYYRIRKVFWQSRCRCSLFFFHFSLKYEYWCKPLMLLMVMFQHVTRTPWLTQIHSNICSKIVTIGSSVQAQRNNHVTHIDLCLQFGHLVTSAMRYTGCLNRYYGVAINHILRMLEHNNAIVWNIINTYFG